LNVYFELGPGDDYAGMPTTWRRMGDVPRPVRTILFGESQSAADHLMPNYWVTAADAVDVASRRHGRKANYCFVDGHAEPLAFSRSFAPQAGVDEWHPGRAGGGTWIGVPGP
jgi:prepilin-type processing-associated H-X9-DG protein